MISVLEFLLDGEIPIDVFINLLKCRTLSTPEIPDKLLDHDIYKIQQEFIPFFLNYLRDQTLHLLQSCKSANPSPAKTPCSQRLKRESCKSNSSASKRVQLFGASPLDTTDDAKITSGSFFSPVSNDTVKFSDTSKQSNGYSKTSVTERSKHRFSLGEFILTPDSNGNQRKKNSPYSAGRRGDRSLDNTPSPLHTGGRQSGGKKRHSLDAHSVRKSQSPAPVFSLNNSVDFPPVGGDKPVTPGTRIGDFFLPDKNDLSSLILRNSPNFDSTPRNAKADKQITKSRRISFSTLPTPHDGSGDAVQSPSRRIKPTPVSGKRVQPKQSKVFLSSPVEQDRGKLQDSENNSTEIDLEDEKILLRQEKAKRLQNQASGTISSTLSPGPITPTKFTLERINSTVVEICVANPCEVTYKEKLDVLVSLYSQCFKENLFPNTTEELYFLAQILTCHSGDLDLLSNFDLDLSDQNYFTTVHNAVYFAVRVLENQTSFLQYMDKSTVRLFSENVRIVKFSPSLRDWLVETASFSSQQAPNTFQETLGKIEQFRLLSSMERIKEALQDKPIYPRSPIGGVSFQAETDNRKNFPSDHSFHLFKKQRDSFYELLREWEASHMLEGWSVLEVMRDRIRALFSHKTDPANHLHFCRLFQSQLIAMCKDDGSMAGSSEDENIDLLSQLKQSNPGKYKRLQERFIKPLSVGGPCPPPSFPGCQEFFHDFVIAVSSPVFNQHLIDTFSSKIIELNKASFSIAESEDNSNEDSDDEQKEVFVSSLLTLRLLGKFLGFVTFLPYQSLTKLPNDTHAMYVSLRKNNLPQVNLSECLKMAYHRERLSLTVPWIVEYLSMMDIIAPDIDYFRHVMLILLYIHKKSWERRVLKNVPIYENLLVTTVISWLLQNSVIPVGFYFSDIPHTVIKMMEESDEEPVVYLDRLGYVNQGLLYKCCPYLGELKTLLVDFAVGSSSKNSTIRKITPVSAEDSIQPSVTEKQLQLQLEENFFHNHPASLKRIVEFVAERTASNFIKKFRSTILQKSIIDSKAALSKHIESQPNGSPSGKAKEKLQYTILKIAQEHVSQVKGQAAGEVKSYCSARIEPLVPLLLPDEQSHAVVTMTIEISLRLAQEKVHQWIDRHIKYSMYQSELMTELDRLIKVQLMNQAKAAEMEPESFCLSIELPRETSFFPVSKEHSYEVRSPSDILINFKDMLKRIILNKSEPDVNYVANLLIEIKNMMNKRQDVQPGMFRSFCVVLMDLVISLITVFPQRWLCYDQEAIVRLLKGELNKGCNLSSIMSCRLIETMKESPDVELSWKHLTDFLIKLLEENLVVDTDLQKKCLVVLTGTGEESLYNLGTCLCDVVEHFNNSEKTEDTGTSINLSDTLEWIYQLSGEDSELSQRVLTVLELDDISFSKSISITSNQYTIIESCDHIQQSSCTDDSEKSGNDSPHGKVITYRDALEGSNLKNHERNNYANKENYLEHGDLGNEKLCGQKVEKFENNCRKVGKKLCEHTKRVNESRTLENIQQYINTSE